MKLPAYFALTALAALAACQSAPTIANLPVATPSPSPTATPFVTAANLTGKWLTGTGTEPPAGPRTVELPCGYAYATIPELTSQSWDLQQVGDSITFTTLPDIMQGPTGPNPACPPHGEKGGGKVTSGQLTLSATATVEAATCPSPFYGSPSPTPAPTSIPVSYALTFEPTTQHLTGTRNGQPFWAVPLIVSGPPSSCPPMPVP
jgi:hypothetical protein